MSLLEKIVNKAQYIADKHINDPKADEYARQQKIQAKQDIEVNKREKKEADDAKLEEEKKAKKKAEAEELVRKSEFKPQRAISESSSIAIKVITGIFIAVILLYGGFLAANRAIGYSIAFRILSFLYGIVLFFYVIPVTLYEEFVLGKQRNYYTVLPLSTYKPSGFFEQVFLGGFCYTEDTYSTNAKKEVETLYSEGFKKSQIKSI